MTAGADRMVERLRAERRRFEVFRKGIVTALDQAVTPWIVTVSDGERSRRMPYINESVEVGDIVHFVDQPDPFAWADVANDGGANQTRPSTAGNDLSQLWYPERDLDAANHETILTPFARVTGSGFEWYPNGIMLIAQSYDAASASLDSVDHPVDPHGNPVTSSWPAGPYAEPVETTRYFDQNGMTLITTEDVGAENFGPAMFRLSGWSYEDRPPVGFSNRWDWNVGYSNFSQRVVRGCPSIKSATFASSPTYCPASTKVYLPTVSAPGPNWPIIYLVHHPTVNHDSIGTYATASIGIDDTDVALSLAGSASASNQGNLAILRTVSKKAGDPQAWVNYSADVYPMMSAIVLTADASYFA